MPPVPSQPFLTEKTVRAAVASLALLFGALCVQGLGDKALWNDEAFSFFVAWRDVAHTLAMIRQDTQPPLYYLALTFWLRLGHDPATLRSLSVLAMTLAVPLVFDAARRLLGMRVALLSALLFAVAPQSVAWAQIARPYALQAFCVAVGFWGFARVWTAAPRAAGRPTCSAAGWRCWRSIRGCFSWSAAMPRWRCGWCARGRWSGGWPAPGCWRNWRCFWCGCRGWRTRCRRCWRI
jgi:4-amino-4-deoxy-L-arabinose transferase-like glycosyltransferase